MTRSFRFTAFVIAAVMLAQLLSGCSPSVNKTVPLTTANFEENVLKSKKPVLVDFWAEWCGPCKQMDPIIKGLAVEYEGKVVVGKVNIDDYPEIVRKYQIEGFPTFLVFKDGVLKRRILGMQLMDFLRSQLDVLQ